MRRPYYRTLWTYLQLQDIERIDALRDRGKQIHIAGLMAMAFAEPKRLTDEYHRWMDDLGMLPTQDETLDRAREVMAAMEAVHAGRLATTADPHAGAPGSAA